MKGFYKYFILLSVLFLAYKLYKADYLSVPVIYSWPCLFISILLLFLGNLSNVLTWTRILAAASIRISFRDGLASIGLSIFGKYIPGFVWTIVGRVGYIGERYRVSKATLSALSLSSQLIVLWSGLLLGILALLLNRDYSHWMWLSLLFTVVFSAILFTPFFNRLLTTGIKKILKREVHVPHLETAATLRLAPYYFLNWLIWCLGFQFMIMAIYTGPVPFHVGLSFALAATIGILVIFTPGGVGVREAVITFFLVKAGLPLKVALTISVSSRLWFLVGEFMYFLSGLWALVIKPR